MTRRVVDGAVSVVDGVWPEAVERVSGPAARLYLALWHRADSAVLVADGDEAVARRLLGAALVPQQSIDLAVGRPGGGLA